MPESVALWFLFFAYSAVFVILFLFVGHTHRRTAELEEEIRRLRDVLSENREEKRSS